MSINRVDISGNLTRDPELRSTRAGRRSSGFGVAVNEPRKNSQTGEWEDYPNFVDCTMFGNRAEALAHPAQGNEGRHRGQAALHAWEKDGRQALEDRGHRR